MGEQLENVIFSLLEDIQTRLGCTMSEAKNVLRDLLADYEMQEKILELSEELQREY